jgi:SdiA-regulated protein
MHCKTILICLLVLAGATACQKKEESVNIPISNIKINTPVPEPKLIALQDIKSLSDKSDAAIDNKHLEELSGITPAMEKNQFWGHNDKGNASELFRFDLNGKVHQKIKLKGIKNDDWEAIERDNDGYLYLGGFGDNEEKRAVYRIHRVKEPDSNSKKISSIDSFRFKYSDDKSHNCEAFFLFNDKFYLITKVDNQSKSTRPEIFRLENLNEGVINTAERLGSFSISGEVTDAAYLNDYQCLFVLTYSEIVLYSADKESDLLSKPISVIDIDFGQCEAIGFNGNDIVITNEKGQIWQYGIDLFLIKK